MHELLLASLLFLAFIALGGAVLGAIAAKRRALRARLAEREGPNRNPEDVSGKGPLLRGLGRVGRVVSPRGASRSLEDKLARAGYYGRSASGTYIGSKVILLLVGIAVSAFFLLSRDVSLHIKLLLVVAGGMVTFFAPNLVVELRRKKRCREVRAHLSDAIDLLEICVSSGMGLDMAWNLIAEEIRGVGPTLADEMSLTNLQIHLGASRVDAMKDMAERTGVEEISSFATLLVQSERFGTSIADALRTFAASMREDRSLRAQEAAEKTAVKLLFPMVLFIFPAMLVVLVGPAAVKLAEVITGGW